MHRQTHSAVTASKSQIQNGDQLVDFLLQQPVKARLTLLNTWTAKELQGLVNNVDLLCDLCNALPFRDLPQTLAKLGENHIQAILPEGTIYRLLSNLRQNPHRQAVLQFLGSDGLNNLLQKTKYAPLRFDLLVDWIKRSEESIKDIRELVINTLGTDKLRALMNNGFDLAKLLALYQPEERLPLLKVLGAPYVNKLVQGKGHDISSVFKQFPANEQRNILLTFIALNADGLRKKVDHAYILAGILQSLPETERLALIEQDLGIAHVKSLIHSADELAWTLKFLNPDQLHHVLDLLGGELFLHHLGFGYDEFNDKRNRETLRQKLSPEQWHIMENYLPAADLADLFNRRLQGVPPADCAQIVQDFFAPPTSTEKTPHKMQRDSIQSLRTLTQLLSTLPIENRPMAIRAMTEVWGREWLHTLLANQPARLKARLEGLLAIFSPLHQLEVLHHTLGGMEYLKRVLPIREEQAAFVRTLISMIYTHTYQTSGADGLKTRIADAATLKAALSAFAMEQRKELLDQLGGIDYLVGLLRNGNDIVMVLPLLPPEYSTTLATPHRLIGMIENQQQLDAVVKAVDQVQPAYSQMIRRAWEEQHTATLPQEPPPINDDHPLLRQVLIRSHHFASAPGQSPKSSSPPAQSPLPGQSPPLRMFDRERMEEEGGERERERERKPGKQKI